MTDFFEDLEVLASRPECEHGLNGPCSECGPSLTLEEARSWRQESRELGIAPTRK
jgi:hypothetical protein